VEAALLIGKHSQRQRPATRTYTAVFFPRSDNNSATVGGKRAPSQKATPGTRSTRNAAGIENRSTYPAVDTFSSS